MTCLKSSSTQTYSSIATGGLLLARQPQQGHPQLRAWRGHKSSDSFALGPHKTQTMYISHITTVENMIRERNTAVLALSCSLDTVYLLTRNRVFLTPLQCAVIACQCVSVSMKRWIRPLPSPQCEAGARACVCIVEWESRITQSTAKPLNVTPTSTPSAPFVVWIYKITAVYCIFSPFQAAIGSPEFMKVCETD